MLFGNTARYAAYNLRNSATPLQKADKNIVKYTKKEAKAAGQQVKAEDKYSNLINKYYNDLAYARSAKINAIDTPDSGDI